MLTVVEGAGRGIGGLLFARRNTAKVLQSDLQQATLVHDSAQTFRNRLPEGCVRAWDLQPGPACTQAETG